MKKVNNIIQILKKSYELYSNDFHEYYLQQFNSSLISSSSFSDGDLKYNTQLLESFIDKCIYYRLGISDIQPSTASILYNLSTSLSPTEYSESLDDIMDKLVYGAYPSRLINKLRSQLESHSLPQSVIDLITSKLETQLN